MTFDERLYKASLKALTDAGVPQELAERASVVVASDTPGQLNFGRSALDQEVVNQAMTHYHAQEKKVTN